MKITIIAFGIGKDILGSRISEMEIPDGSSVKDLSEILALRYPALKEIISYSIAVNHEYADGNAVVMPSDEIALIPPVSGG